VFEKVFLNRRISSTNGVSNVGQAAKKLSSVGANEHQSKMDAIAEEK